MGMSEMGGDDWERELMRKIRFGIAQFKIKNSKVAKNLPIILTLRTRDEFGKFPFKPQTSTTAPQASATAAQSNHYA